MLVSSYKDDENLQNIITIVKTQQREKFEL